MCLWEKWKIKDSRKCHAEKMNEAKTSNGVPEVETPDYKGMVRFIANVLRLSES